jgi:hypothetical protein
MAGSGRLPLVEPGHARRRNRERERQRQDGEDERLEQAHREPRV